MNEEIKSPGSSEPIDDLMSRFYDSSKKKVKKCKPTTGKCFFPFYIGIAEGATDLRKVFKMILDGALNQSNEGFLLAVSRPIRGNSKHPFENL